MSQDAPQIEFADRTAETFLGDLLDGLSRPQKSIPCKYLYDEIGSDLFERICDLDEYYPTRTELSILRRQGKEIADEIGPRAMLVEFGSGSGVKTRLLLERLDEPAAYVPIDVSESALAQSSADLAREFPDLEVLPVCADFAGEYDLPRAESEPQRRAVFFPGSTIGNLDAPTRQHLLQRMAQLADGDGRVVIGIDLQKDVPIVEAAYNDRAGVTAQFNLNLLARANRELEADFDLDAFEHRAFYNAAAGRVEIYLVSRRRQTATIGDKQFHFEPDEAILTEHSHKFTIDGFAAEARQAGLIQRVVWTDPHRWFAILAFAPDE